MNGGVKSLMRASISRSINMNARGGIYFKYKIRQFFSTCKVSYLQEKSAKQERSGERVLPAASAELAEWHNFVDKGFRQAFAIVNESTRQI